MSNGLHKPSNLLFHKLPTLYHSEPYTIRTQDTHYTQGKMHHALLFIAVSRHIVRFGRAILSLFWLIANDAIPKTTHKFLFPTQSSAEFTRSNGGTAWPWACSNMDI
ncbi:hypothetical protein PILCRDRAFT_824304 [Piloderma croceum F 1598]|uniref:Uncharacterized protein n=1 Tax=Piloderma croceum (strain F 1598) TaxID=765440 RepID=A0A0C3AWN2_PILCF|nr:hypothetical protein PILCRDRAFT_824304 [Piloderma croceum F 1598]